MTLGEERFYQAVWHAKDADGVFRESPRSKTFSLGYDRLSRLVRLDEKSVRQLVPKLIVKKILEVIASEDSAARIGRTYRIFSYEEILERQRAANLLFIVKRGRAVEFVQPYGSHPIPNRSDGVSVSVGVTPSVVDTPTGPVSPAVGQTPTPSVGIQPVESVGVTPTPLDRPSATISSQPSSSVIEALRQYVFPDDDAVRVIITNCRKSAPDASFDEIVHFIHERGRVLRNGRISNPLAYLIVYVPKCFQGEAFRQYREEQLRAEKRGEAAAAQAEVDLTAMRAEWAGWLDDPAISEEEKEWARRMLLES